MEKCPEIFYGSDFIDDAEKESAIEVLESQSLFRYYGKNILFKADEFETRICDYTGAKHSLVVSSGTASIKCALKAVGVNPGDEVIVPAYGFIATAGAVHSIGAKPVFADIDYSMNIDIEDIKKKISEKTKAIVVVHLYGKGARIDDIVNVAHEKGLYVIEDVAQAFGAELHGKKLGTIGDIGCLSFQQNKIITTGEGGAIITNNYFMFKRAKMYQDQGGLRIGNKFPTWNDSECFLGENLRMGELVAAIGIEQIKKIDRILTILRRRKSEIGEILRKYNVTLSPVEGLDCGSTTILIMESMEQRDVLLLHLKENGVTASKYYNATVYSCGLFGKVEPCKRAESLCHRIIGIPTPAAMSGKDFKKYLNWIDKSFFWCFNATNKMVKKMYKKGICEIAELNLLPYKTDYIDDKIVFNNVPVNIDEMNCLVVGGPCIDRCDGVIEKLTLDFYFDLAMVINKAITYNKPCAIYIDTPIEQFSDKKSKEKWIFAVDKIEKFIENLSPNCIVELSLIRREDSMIMLDELLSKQEVVIGQSMYNLIPSAEECELEEWLVKHYRRVVMEYHRTFLNKYLNSSYENVIVIEGLSQCKAVNYAMKTDDSIRGQFYIDMPSVSGKNRMHRSIDGAITIFENLEKYEDTDVFKYWEILNMDALYENFGVHSFVNLIKEWNKLWERKN